MSTQNSGIDTFVAENNATYRVFLKTNPPNPGQDTKKR